MIKVFFYNEHKFPVGVAEVGRIAKAAAKKEPRLKGEVEIILVDNNEIKKLNRQWRKINRPTDVLAFAWQEEGVGKRDCLGQVFISFPKIAAQAREYGATIKQEFTMILIHGLLHLAGYDHAKPSDRKKMFSLQDKITASIE